jgi:hypothetical protein
MRCTGLGTHLAVEWTTLREQEAEVAELDGAITANLKELGYGG